MWRLTQALFETLTTVAYALLATSVFALLLMCFRRRDARDEIAATEETLVKVRSGTRTYSLVISKHPARISLAVSERGSVMTVLGPEGDYAVYEFPGWISVQATPLGRRVVD